MRTSSDERASERLPKRRGWLRRLASLVCAVVVLVPLLRGRVRAGQASDISPTLKGLVARACDSSLPFQERLTAYHALFNEPLAARQEALRQLASRADEEVAAMAAARLVQEHEEGVAELIGPRFPAWSHSNQWQIIGDLLSHGPQPSLWELPRIVLRNAVQTKTAADEFSDAGRVTSLAALILTKSADPADKALIGQVAAAQPRLSGVWLARASAGPLGPAESKLAASVFADERALEAIRLAAAVALAPTNKEASAFVARTLREFLTRYGSQDVELMLVHAFQEMESNSASSDQAMLMPELGTFLNRLKLLGALQFLNTAWAEPLTFEFLNARNLLIRKTLGLVAAIRWPQHLLRAGQGGFGSNEYTSLLAAIALYHPQLLDALYLKAGAKALDEARAELNLVGLHGPFFKAAGAAFGF